MQIERVTVRMGRTQNTGDYSSVHAEEEYTAILEPGDEAEDVRQELYGMAKANVVRRIAELKESYVDDWPRVRTR